MSFHETQNGPSGRASDFPVESMYPCSSVVPILSNHRGGTDGMRQDGPAGCA
jgi:hypothetical protein